MEDSNIINLYWDRNENAIVETSKKYGGLCQGIAFNILSVREDAQECVNDTWYRAWNAIPPEYPQFFSAWLGRIVRNLSLDRWHKKHAQKRDCGMEQMLSELEECIPSSFSVEEHVEAGEVANWISKWLDQLSKVDRALFVRRYWYGEALQELAAETGIPSGKLAQKMFRLRKHLKKYLEQKGVIL